MVLSSMKGQFLHLFLIDESLPVFRRFGGGTVFGFDKDITKVIISAS